MRMKEEVDKIEKKTKGRKRIRETTNKDTESAERKMNENTKRR